MHDITIAIPSETDTGLSGKRSGHFDHCPVFTLVCVQGNQITDIRAVDNIAHSAGNSMQPAAMLAEHGVNAMVASGIGPDPFKKMQQHGIKVYFADLNIYPDVQTTIEGFIQGKLPIFGFGQRHTGADNCLH